jgi:hypothetical protein
MSSLRRVRAILGIIRSNSPALLVRAHAVINAMNSPKTPYVSPPITAAALLVQTQAVETAQQAVVARFPGAAAARKPKTKALVTSLELQCTYIQSVADASPDQAEAIIDASGFVKAEPTGYAKPFLSAKPVYPDGSVYLAAYAQALLGDRKGRHLFCWQSSVDGGRTWTDAPTTPVAATTIAGLPRLTSCSFRVAARNAVDQTPWSPVVTVLVP